MSAVSGLGPDRTNLPEGVELARLQVLGARDQGLDLRKRPWRDRCVVESTRETRDAGNPLVTRWRLPARSTVWPPVLSITRASCPWREEP